MAKKAADQVAETVADANETEKGSNPGKGKPTPTRKEAQARRARPLVGDTTKEARRQLRAEMREKNAKIREGQMNGDERYLLARDKGPQRRFVRDYIDSRWSVGEFMLPIMFVIVLLTFLPSYEVASLASLSMLAVFALIVADSLLIVWALKRRLTAKFGEDLQRGWRFYAIMRALQMRMLRLPKPQVRRGAKIK
ncbi:MAG: DUF3043 domain-containing protein [Microbacteriaceae bacterium]|nr:DUF3043 domain-containing protein [Microbacteriaceae bacterium]